MMRLWNSNTKLWRHLLEARAIEVYVADNYTTQERVWKVRRNIAEAFKVYSPVQSLDDIVVPFCANPGLNQRKLICSQRNTR